MTNQEFPVTQCMRCPKWKKTEHWQNSLKSKSHYQWWEECW